MVLLTSSAVSAAVSAGIVCIFTFLLFLSGYVLQQQTVRSLQEAIRNPPEKPWYPKPTLPPQFQEENETRRRQKLDNVDMQTIMAEDFLGLGGEQDISLSEEMTSNVKQSQELSPLELWHEYLNAQTQSPVDGQEELVTPQKDEATNEATPYITDGRHAYILTIPSTTDLCSVVLFTEWHRLLSKVSPQPSIVYIYPATWEMSDSPIHTGAMNLIRKMQDEHGIICHPISISRIWAGVSVETQLLAELQRTRWIYDRAMYLRSPGMALDIAILDQALTSSSVKKSWQALSPKSTTLTPSLLLYEHEHGLLAPKADMKHLTAYAHPANPDELTVHAKHAGYVIFDEKDLQHRRREQTRSTGIFERFERERRNACVDTAIISRFDMEDA